MEITIMFSRQEKDSDQVALHRQQIDASGQYMSIGAAQKDCRAEFAGTGADIHIWHDGQSVSFICSK